MLLKLQTIRKYISIFLKCLVELIDEYDDDLTENKKIHINRNIW